MNRDAGRHCANYCNFTIKFNPSTLFMCQRSISKESPIKSVNSKVIVRFPAPFYTWVILTSPIAFRVVVLSLRYLHIIFRKQYLSPFPIDALPWFITWFVQGWQYDTPVTVTPKGVTGFPQPNTCVGDTTNLFYFGKLCRVFSTKFYSTCDFIIRRLGPRQNNRQALKIQAMWASKFRHYRSPVGGWFATCHY